MVLCLFAIFLNREGRKGREENLLSSFVFKWFFSCRRGISILTNSVSSWKRGASATSLGAPSRSVQSPRLN